jgi:hypothetical protein
MNKPCVYIKVSGSEVIFLILYVDDILLIGNYIPLLQWVNIWLSKNFSMYIFWIKINLEGFCVSIHVHR